MTTFGKPWSVEDLEKHLRRRPEARIPAHTTDKLVKTRYSQSSNDSEPSVQQALTAQGPVGVALLEAVTGRKAESQSITITITGQIRGGKNNYIVTRKGKHIPKKEWAKWRDEKVEEVRNQLPQAWEPVSTPVKCSMEYVTGDKRRRDFPAVVDSVFHVLEKAGVVTDDTLIWVTTSSRSYSKERPKCCLTLVW